MRSAMNRHLQNLVRSIDFVRDKEFSKSANYILDVMMKVVIKTGASCPTLSIIWNKFFQYFPADPFSPHMLRQCVWFDLSAHLVSRGLEYPHQLHTNSYRYVFIWWGWWRKYISSTWIAAAAFSRRLQFVMKLPLFPIVPNVLLKILCLLLSKIDKHAINLFNACVKDDIIFPSYCETKAIIQWILAEFM